MDEPGRIFGFCVEGQFCDGKSVENLPEPCALGTYNNLTHQSKCQTCPRGYFCAGEASMPEPCSEGKYCTEGTVVEEECDIGTFNPSKYGYSKNTHCQKCTPGYKCPTTGMSAPEPCAAGVYCKNGVETPCRDGFLCPALSDAEQTCPYGFTCDGNTTSTPCPAGSYCEFGIQKNCPAGAFCELESRYPEKCVPGTYSNSTGLTSDACLPCLNGYCPYYGLTNDSTYTVLDGYYCDGECGKNATPAECPAGSRCNNGAQTRCDGPSEFQPVSGQDVCEVCGPGFTCNSTLERIECPEGTFCEEGVNTQQDCNTGYYGFPLNHGSPDFDSACNPCPPGHICETVRMTLADATTANYCPAGKICSGGIGSEANAEECPKGFYCSTLDAIAIETNIFGFPCDIGKFANVTGGTDVNHCQSCPEYHVRLILASIF